jgi:hypothetical protein
MKNMLSIFFLTVTTAGISQPEHIFSQCAYEAFQPLQDGFKSTRVTEVTRVKKKKKNTPTTHKTEEKKWPPHKPGGRLADENSSQPKHSDHKEKPQGTQEGHHNSSPRRSNRTALDRRDPTTTLHRRRNWREACI